MRAPKVRACRYCGCTDDRACPGGCFWVTGDVCSADACVDQLAAEVRRLNAEARRVARRERRPSAGGAR